MKTIVGMFENTRDVDGTMDDLAKLGYSKENIGVLARKEVLKESKLDLSTGAEVGAITGATAGGIAGLLLGLGALTIPGIGPIVAAGEFLTWVGATVLGAAAGAVGGGLVGSLVSLGLPEHEAHVYAEGVKRGNILVTVRTADARAQEVTDVLRRHNAVDVNTRRQEWETQGWTSFNELGPMPSSQMSATDTQAAPQ
ncbi:MAG: hypothetical protein OJF49_001021 [Ktedonobacterales bacterium]|jgi:uncharacterized membrane protein|nr:MAG: hypothetical protein OJF49_001021 [Ktedonobacterales bacterium]